MLPFKETLLQHASTKVLFWGLFNKGQQNMTGSGRKKLDLEVIHNLKEAKKKLSVKSEVPEALTQCSNL